MKTIPKKYLFIPFLLLITSISHAWHPTTYATPAYTATTAATPTYTVTTTATPPYIVTTVPYKPISSKSAGVAGGLNLLGFLGIGGIGRLYGGSTGMGIAQLLLSFILPGVGQIWSIIDGAYILSGSATDNHGRHITHYPEAALHQMTYPYPY